MSLELEIADEIVHTIMPTMDQERFIQHTRKVAEILTTGQFVKSAIRGALLEACKNTCTWCMKEVPVKLNKNGRIVHASASGLDLYHCMASAIHRMMEE